MRVPLAIALAVGAIGLAQPALAQPNPATTAGAPPTSSNVAVVGVPIPIANEAIGKGLGGAAGIVFGAGTPGSKTPPSIVGGGGGYTDSHTWLAAGGGNLLLGANRVRLLGGYAHASLHYRLFGTGTDAGNDGKSVPVDQTADFLIGEALVRTAWQVFVGGRYAYITTDVGLSSDVIPPDGLPLPPDVPPPGTERNVSIHAIAFRAERDSRNDRFWPTSGSMIDLTAGAVDNRAALLAGWFQTYQASGNVYVAISAKQTVAARVMGCEKRGDHVPFFQLCQFGMQGDLRGYETGRYRDHFMFATQAEYRLILPYRLAIAVFGGVGEVAPTVGAINSANLLPAGGAGLRFALSSKYRVNYRFDYAVGKNGGTWIVSLGEAF
jgi:hypothetical protein